MERSSDPGAGKAVLLYNVGRLLLLLACLGLGWIAGLSGFPLIVVALLASGLLSWFLLRRQRIRMGVAIEEKVALSRERLARRAAAEDEYDEAQRRAAAASANDG